MGRPARYSDAGWALVRSIDRRYRANHVAGAAPLPRPRPLPFCGRRIRPRGPQAVFDGLERDPGSITTADDPRYGASIKHETWDWSNGKERCESRGMRKNGSPYRIGSAAVAP